MRGDWFALPADVDIISLLIDLIEFAASRAMIAFDDVDAQAKLRQIAAQSKT